MEQVFRNGPCEFQEPDENLQPEPLQQPPGGPVPRDERERDRIVGLVEQQFSPGEHSQVGGFVADNILSEACELRNKDEARGF